MAPSERAKRMRREAEGGSGLSAAAQFTLGVWHQQGLEGLDQDDMKAVVWFCKAADLGFARAEAALAGCYGTGRGVQQNLALAAEWGRKAADQGDTLAQFVVGRCLALGKGVKKDLPLGKRYLELSAAQGFKDAVMLLKQLRQCVACGRLDVHHMICSQCRNRRYCDKGCQLWHWNSATDPHKLHCVKRREAVGSGSGAADPSADENKCAMKEALNVEAAAAASKMEVARTAAVFASAAAAATVVAVTAARAAMLAAPATSKKEKKKKAKLVAKVKAAEATAEAEAAALVAAAEDFVAANEAAWQAAL